MLVRLSHKISQRIGVRVKDLNAVIAHAASLMLTGVPPEVCESAINELYCSVKRSLHTII